MELKNLLLYMLVSTMGVAPAYAAHTNGHQVKPLATLTTPEMKNDAIALAWVMAVDKNEITLGKLAKHKSTDKAVIKYADMMVTQHGKNLKSAEKLSHQLKIKPEKTDAIEALKKQGAREKTELQTAKGADFQKDYINAMVAGHENVLNTLDTNYINNVKNPAVKAFLQETRNHVQDHLTEAKKIQQDLGTTTANNG